MLRRRRCDLSRLFRRHLKLCRCLRGRNKFSRGSTWIIEPATSTIHNPGSMRHVRQIRKGHCSLNQNHPCRQQGKEISRVLIWHKDRRWSVASGWDWQNIFEVFRLFAAREVWRFAVGPWFLDGRCHYSALWSWEEAFLYPRVSFFGMPTGAHFLRSAENAWNEDEFLQIIGMLDGEVARIKTRSRGRLPFWAFKSQARSQIETFVKCKTEAIRTKKFGYDSFFSRHRKKKIGAPRKQETVWTVHFPTRFAVIPPTL